MNKRIIAAVAIVVIIVAAFVALWQLNVFAPAQTINIGVVAGCCFCFSTSTFLYNITCGTIHTTIKT